MHSMLYIKLKNKNNISSIFLNKNIANFQSTPILNILIRIFTFPSTTVNHNLPSKKRRIQL